MKKIILSTAASVFLLSALQTQLKANNNDSNIIAKDTITTVDSVAINALTLRLNEIEALDKSNMTRPEKKALRQEVKDIKGELKELGNGVYISVGALIIIIILLIILL